MAVKWKKEQICSAVKQIAKEGVGLAIAGELHAAA